MRISDWSSDVCSSDLTASFAVRSLATGDTPSSEAPSRAGRLRFRKSNNAMSSPSVLGHEVGGGDLARSELALGDRHGQGARWSDHRSEEHTSELQSLMRISYAVFCLKKKKTKRQQIKQNQA